MSELEAYVQVKSVVLVRFPSEISNKIEKLSVCDRRVIQRHQIVTCLGAFYDLNEYLLYLFIEFASVTIRPQD